MSDAENCGAGVWARDDAVDNWNRMAVARNQYLAPVTEMMLERSHLIPGSNVLDLGTGTGDTAILAARRVKPGGLVLGTDISPQMIEGARQAARNAGTDNASFRVMDATAIDLPPSSLDAAIGRNVLMFVPDLTRAANGVYAALKPGAVFATTVWAPLDRNPFQQIIIETSRTMGGLPASPPELLLAFSLPSSRVVEAMEQAGFHDVSVQAVALRRVDSSAAAAAQAVRETSLFRSALAGLVGAQLELALEEIERRFAAFEGPSGCEFPLESLLIVGAK